MQRPDPGLLRMLGGLEGFPVAQAFFGQDGPGRSIRCIKHVLVKGSQLHGRMQGRCRGAADEQGRIQSAGVHLPAQLLHLEQRRSDEPAYADEGGMMFLRGLQDGLLVHHHAQVHHLESVAAEDDAGDVLADVMDIPLDRRVDDDGLLRGLLAFLHVRFQDGDGVLHHLGRLDDLREEHLPFAEASSNLLHPGHQRPLDDRHGAPQPLQGGPDRFLQVLGTAGDKHLPERFLDSAFGFARNDRTLVIRGRARPVLVILRRAQPFLVILRRAQPDERI